MSSRLVLAGLAVLSLSACDHGDKAAIEADQVSNAGAPPPAAAPASPAEAVLVEVWQTANPGVAPPSLARIGDAFDPRFQQIFKAPNDADNAFVASTLAFIQAIKAVDPVLCAEAPLARFTAPALAAVPADALPEFRTMLTDRLAVIAAGTARTAPPEDLMSGSMQNASQDLGDDAAVLLPRIAAGAAYDPATGCDATIRGWDALKDATQSPQLTQMIYELGAYAPQ